MVMQARRRLHWDKCLMSTAGTITRRATTPGAIVTVVSAPSQTSPHNNRRTNQQNRERNDFQERVQTFLHSLLVDSFYIGKNCGGLTRDSETICLPNSIPTRIHQLDKKFVGTFPPSAGTGAVYGSLPAISGPNPRGTRKMNAFVRQPWSDDPHKEETEQCPTTIPTVIRVGRSKTTYTVNSQAKPNPPGFGWRSCCLQQYLLSPSLFRANPYPKHRRRRRLAPLSTNTLHNPITQSSGRHAASAVLLSGQDSC